MITYFISLKREQIWIVTLASKATDQASF